ncbi:MAG: hypothetical protein JO356_02230 [Acidobacteria bacterium]|nr:hypothetical protein [Acidobacteriota bacterium]
MNNALSWVLLTVLLTALFGGQAPVAPSATSQNAPNQPENATKAKAIIDEGIQALGGAAYLGWQNMTFEGRSYSFHHGEANSVGTLFWRFKKFPDKDRIELTKKRDVIELFSGDKGYEITFRGVRNLDEKEELAPYLRRRHFSLEIVLRQWLNEPGLALFYDGQTVAAQKETEQVTIMNAKNEGVTINFDVNTHLPVKKSFTWRDPVDRQRNLEEEIYDNYRRVDGIMTPYDITRTFNGDMAAQSFLTSANYNQSLSDGLFDPGTANAKHH